MAKLSTVADLKQAIEKDREIEAETFIRSTQHQSVFRVDSLGVVWELETGDWQCPSCTSIVEASEPACLCKLVECLDANDEVDLNLLPF